MRKRRFLPDLLALEQKLALDGSLGGAAVVVPPDATPPPPPLIELAIGPEPIDITLDPTLPVPAPPPGLSGGPSTSPPEVTPVYPGMGNPWTGGETDPVGPTGHGGPGSIVVPFNNTGLDGPPVSNYGPDYGYDENSGTGDGGGDWGPGPETYDPDYGAPGDFTPPGGPAATTSSVSSAAG